MVAIGKQLLLSTDPRFYTRTALPGMERCGMCGQLQFGVIRFEPARQPVVSGLIGRYICVACIEGFSEEARRYFSRIGITIERAK